MRNFTLKSLKKKKKKPLQPNPVSKPQESHPNNRIKEKKPAFLKLAFNQTALSSPAPVGVQLLGGKGLAAVKSWLWGKINGGGPKY